MSNVRSCNDIIMVVIRMLRLWSVREWYGHEMFSIWYAYDMTCEWRIYIYCDMIWKWNEISYGMWIFILLKIDQ